MILRLSILLAIVSVAACGNSTSSAPSEDRPAAARTTLRGATIKPGGYATILDAPPASFTPTDSAAVPPPPLPADQAQPQQQWHRVTEFQNQVREDVERLSNKLRTAEKGNFVDLYYENEGEPHVVFRFLRDGGQTLSKYSRDLRLVASEVRYSREQLRAAMDFMLETFREDRVIQGGGIGSKSNRAEVEITVPPQEFWALVRTKGISIPEAVKLDFRATQTAGSINRPLPRGIAPLLHIFPRDDRPIGILHSIESRAKVVLQDGCFRVSGGEHDKALVLFPLGAQLFIDREGYLAYGQGEGSAYARVGEEIVFPGSIGTVTAPGLVKPIHDACGVGKVVKVTAMASAAAQRSQSRVTENANSLRQLRDFYGLSGADARKVFEACKKSFGQGTCVLSPPPPMRREECPPGTSFSSGLCRTPEGYLRPLPKWMEAVISVDR